MKNKIHCLIADDVELDRLAVIDSFFRLAPEFQFDQHSQGATLLNTLLAYQTPPRLLMLDIAFTDDQTKRSRYNQQMTALAKEIRKNHPSLNGMAILIYSRWLTAEQAAKDSDEGKSVGIWYRTKEVNHSLLVDHARYIVSVWPNNQS